MWNLLYSWAVSQLNSSICLMIYLNKRFTFLLKKKRNCDGKTLDLLFHNPKIHVAYAERK